MAPTLESLGIDKLDIDDRMELVRSIEHSVDAEIEAMPLTEAMKQELDRRLAEHDANPSAAVPWEEVRARILEELERMRKPRESSWPKPIARLLNYLEHMKSRPALYIRREDDTDAAMSFLVGFSLAASASLGWKWDLWRDVREAAIRSRGWRVTSTSPHHQMLEKSFSAKQILEELIEIEAGSCSRPE